jgi:hypothetical protein
MSLTDSQIIDVALRVNAPDFLDLDPVTNSHIVDVAIVVDSPGSVDLLDIIVPTVNIVATNTGPRGPQGDSGQWVALTQSEYDQLNPPDPDVLYVIIQ